MQKLFYIFSFILSAFIFSAVLPYPVFSNHTNITESIAYDINNFHEIEISNVVSKEPKILSLDFSIMDSLLPIDSQFEVCDLQSKLSFLAKRTGGQFHLDIEPLDKQNAKILQEIAGEDWSWKRREALVKINDNTFVPASFSAYPHGHETLHTINGHICLHFLNSKTDGTKEEDLKYQQCIKLAQKYGKKYLQILEG